MTHTCVGNRRCKSRTGSNIHPWQRRELVGVGDEEYTPANMTGWFILNNLVNGVEKTGFEEGMVGVEEQGAYTLGSWPKYI